MAAPVRLEMSQGERRLFSRAIVIASPLLLVIGRILLAPNLLGLVASILERRSRARAPLPDAKPEGAEVL
jgi:hypothetical protein